MKLRKLLVIPVLASALGVAVFAAEKPPENFKKAMKDLNAFQEGTPKALAADDYDAVAKFADSAKDAFVIIQEFWTKKADTAAAQTSEEGLKAAGDLSVTASLKSKEGSEYSVKIINDTCAGCHTAHREKAAADRCGPVRGAFRG